MQCPNDGATLLMSERHGVEVDYCPTCRGVWLDKGELDKIIERTRDDDDDDDVRRAPSTPAAPAASIPPPPPPPPPRDYYRDDDRYERERYDRDRYDPRYRKKKKRSFLEDIFDFD